VRRRLLVANLAMVVGLLVALEVPLAFVYSRHEHDALDSQLQRDAATLGALAGDALARGGADLSILSQRFAVDPGEVVTIVDATGRNVSANDQLALDPALVRALDGARVGRTTSGEAGDLTFVAAPVTTRSGPVGAVLVGRSDAAIDDRVQRAVVLLVVLGVGVVALALAISDRLGRWVADPLRRLDDRTAAFGRGELSARADPTLGPPEVATLAGTFNEMADRLDALVSSQRRFVADASHQLRTPLTALRLRLENLDASEPDHVDPTRDAALDEVARLTRLVDGLLSLARAESQRPARTPVAVGDVLAERQQAWAPLAAEQDVVLGVAGHTAAELVAELVPGHLEQILDNLIANALDASAAGQTVELRAERRDGSVVVHVVDQGRGMAEDERRHAFDPFWRSPANPAGGGSGLGLAIAEQLARASRGTIALEVAPAGGIDAVVRFPAGSVRDPTGATT
jgi:signal transduction histidine kinase